MSNPDSKTNMQAHSVAKVSLYRRYLFAYFSILSRVPSVRRIYVFDLLCGEGEYLNNHKGSPIIALDAAVKVSTDAGPNSPEIILVFNDDGKSLIEPGVDKIDRVRRLAESVERHEKVKIEYHCEDFASVLPLAEQLARRNSDTRSLFFLDPYGYPITPTQVSNILSVRTTEVLLFMPASFMYRFAEKAAVTEFAGSAQLANFLSQLYPGQQPKFATVHDFIEQTKYQFRSFISNNLKAKVYVDTFTLDKGDGNVYCLFFFTSQITGYEKMLEAKWAEDKDSGRGHRADSNLPLFTSVELEYYEDYLWDYVATKPGCTNHDIYSFGLDRGFLPKHSNGLLKRWLIGGKLVVVPLDGKTITKNATYVSDRNRDVGFSLG